MKSLEEHSRELVRTIVNDGLMVLAKGVRDPEDMSNGDVLAIANHLNRILKEAQMSQGKAQSPQDTVVSVIKHTVDLGTSPRLPFCGTEVVKHDGTGTVELELRSDDNLYVDGKKVTLFLSERQVGDLMVVGHKLCQELENGDQVLLNSNILDYLYDHPELFPEHWKKDENGEIRRIYFWGSVFRNPMSVFRNPLNDRLYVRFLEWNDGKPLRNHSWLNHHWSRRDPSASVASST